MHSVDGRALYACPISGDTPVHGPARTHACTGGAEVTVSQVQAEIARLETQAEAARLSKSHWSLLRLLSGAGDILTALNAPGAAAQFQRRLLTQSAELVNLPVSIRLHVKLALSLRLSCAEHGELGGAEEGEGGLAMEAAQLLTRAEGDMTRLFVCCCPLLLWLASSPQTDVCVCVCVRARDSPVLVQYGRTPTILCVYTRNTDLYGRTPTIRFVYMSETVYRFLGAGHWALKRVQQELSEARAEVLMRSNRFGSTSLPVRVSFNPLTVYAPA